MGGGISKYKDYFFSIVVAGLYQMFGADIKCPTCKEEVCVSNLLSKHMTGSHVFVIGEGRGRVG